MRVGRASVFFRQRLLSVPWYHGTIYALCHKQTRARPTVGRRKAWSDNFLEIY